MSQDGMDARKGLSRRDLFKTGAAGVAAALGGTHVQIGAASGATVIEPEPDLVLVNGKIHTMDAQSRIASSITIRGGRIIALEYGGHGNHGSHGPQRIVDLKGRPAVPGIIDNHNHIVLMGNRPGYHTPLENAYSIEDAQETLAARAAGVPNGQFITTIGGFHFNQFAERRLPTLAELDEALPNHPVYVSIGFSGPSTTNSLGRVFFQNAPLPVTVGADGSIAAGTQSGRALLALRQALLDFEQRKRGALDALDYGATVGVTTHLDEGAFQATNTPSDGAAHEDNYTMHLPFLALYREGQAKVRLRINFLHMESDPALPGLLARLQNAFPFFGDDMVRTGGIGEFIAQGTGATFVEAAKRVARAGWRAEVHSLSTTDFQQEIAAFETANQEAPITDLRWVVAHVPFITAPFVDRLKALGGGLSLTGWRYLAGTPAGNGPPFRMIVDNGIHSGMSSDGMQIAPMNPWLHMYYAVTGVNAMGQLINGSQQITRQEVLRLYTRDNGWFLREEDQLGSLEPGKLGDLVVLDRDYFTVPDADIRHVRSILTVVAGEIVYNAGLLKVTS